MKNKKRKIKAKKKTVRRAKKAAKKIFRASVKKAKRAKKKKPAPVAKKARKASKQKRESAPVKTSAETKTKSKSKGRKMAKKAKSKSKKSGKSIFGSQRGSAMLPPKKIVMHGLQKLANGAEGVAMAKVTQMVISKLPISSPGIKAGIQAGAGFVGSLFTDTKPWLKGLSDGPYYIGLSALSKAFGMETMAGEEDYHLAVDPEGNVREMTGEELEELQGNFDGDESSRFAMQGNFDGDDDGDDMDGEGFDLG